MPVKLVSQRRAVVQNTQLEADNPVLQVVFSQLIIDIVAWSQNTTSLSLFRCGGSGVICHSLEFSKGGVRDGVSNKIPIL